MTKRQPPASGSITRGPTEEMLKALVDYVLDGASDTNVVIGPIVSNGTTNEQYFTISACEPERGWRSDSVTINVDSLRQDVIAAFTKRSITVHDIADELDAIRLCESLWPGERVTHIRKEVEAERASWARGEPEQYVSPAGLVMHFRLPLGYRVTFRQPDITKGAIGLWETEWHPKVPRISNARHRKRFLKAYDAARNQFLAEVATIIGGVVVVDANADLTVVDKITTIEPNAKH